MITDERMRESLEKFKDEVYKRILNTAPVAAKQEDNDMYMNLEITFKSGETITYKTGEWDDYAYDGGAVIVKHDGAWVGIYNFDHVFCVELKK